MSILGYSVFGYLESMDEVEHFPLMLIVDGPPNWPIHLTLLTAQIADKHQMYNIKSGIAKNYYHLADSQIYMGLSMILTYVPIFYNQLYRDKRISDRSSDMKMSVQFILVIGQLDFQFRLPTSGKN